MNKKRDLNIAQAVLIGIVCNNTDNVEINKWLMRHPVLSGVLYAIVAILTVPVNIVSGFKRPADDVLDLAETYITSANLSNLAIRENIENCIEEES